MKRKTYASSVVLVHLSELKPVKYDTTEFKAQNDYSLNLIWDPSEVIQNGFASASGSGNCNDIFPVILLVNVKC